MTARKHIHSRPARKAKRSGLFRAITKHFEGMLTQTTTALTKLAKAHNRGVRRASYHGHAAGSRRRARAA